MAYDYDPRRKARKGRVPPQLRAWVFRRKRKAARRRYDPEPRRRRYRRYDPRRITRRGIGRGIFSTGLTLGAFIFGMTRHDLAWWSAQHPGASFVDTLKAWAEYIPKRLSLYHWGPTGNPLVSGNIGAWLKSAFTNPLMAWGIAGVILRRIPIRFPGKSIITRPSGPFIAGSLLGALLGPCPASPPGAGTYGTSTPYITERTKEGAW